VCSDGGHVEYQECRAGFTEDASLTDGKRESLEPLILPFRFTFHGKEGAIGVLLEAGAAQEVKYNMSCASDLSRVIFKVSGRTTNQSSLVGESLCVCVGFGEVGLRLLGIAMRA